MSAMLGFGRQMSRGADIREGEQMSSHGRPPCLACPSERIDFRCRRQRTTWHWRRAGVTSPAADKRSPSNEYSLRTTTTPRGSSRPWPPAAVIRQRRAGNGTRTGGRGLDDAATT